METQDRIWHEGFPEKKGRYLCRENGEEMILKHYFCTLTGRHEWAHEDDSMAYGIVEWTGKPL